MNHRILGACVLSSAAIVTGCAREAPPAEPQVLRVAGDCQPAFGADICSWAEVAGERLVAWGITVPMTSIDGAPPDAPMVLPPVVNAVVALPAAVTAASGLRNLTFYWEAHGHPPRPFMTPHFDFHFNNIDEDTRAAIDCSDVTKPEVLADGYELPDMEIEGFGTLVGICVPQMGMHSVPAADLAAEEAFEKTLIVGYYRGAPIFVEPMIASATLAARQDFTMALPAVPGWDPALRTPRSMQARHDATIDAWEFRFSD